MLLPLLSIALGCANALPTGNPAWTVLPIAQRALHPRDMDLGSRLSWLADQAAFLEGRYPGNGLAQPDLTRLAKRSFPDVPPFDIAPERRRREAREVDAKRKRAEATVALTGLYSNGGGVVSDLGYLANAGVGTPVQQFNLQVDTGSSQLWVATSSAYAEAEVPKSTFNSNASTSWRRTSSQLATLTYGSGQIQGILGTDTVEIGGIGLGGQSILIAQAVTSAFQTGLFDGLMGLAFSTLSPTGQPTFFENLAASGQLTSPVFSLYLERALDNATIASQTSVATSAASSQGLTSGGELVMGGYDSNRFVGNLSFAPLITKSYWLVQQDGVWLNGQQLANSRFAAAIDSGTSLTILPTAVANEMASALGGRMTTLPGTSNLQSTFLVVPCSIQDPAIEFGFAGIRWPMNLTDILMGYYDTTGQQCVLGILGRDVPQSQTQRTTYISVIGDSLLKNLYTCFSLSGTGAVGFARLATPSTTSVSDITSPTETARTAGATPGTLSSQNTQSKSAASRQALTKWTLTTITMACMYARLL